MILEKPQIRILVLKYYFIPHNAELTFEILQKLYRVQVEIPLQ